MPMHTVGLKMHTIDAPDIEGPVMFLKYVELTQQLTRPVIIKNFFDPSSFRDICTCSDHVSFFDDISMPYKAGNQKFQQWTGDAGTVDRVEFINAGDFYRNRVCQKKDDYLFLDDSTMLYWSSRMSQFFGKIGSMLRTSETVKDPVFYPTGWVHEMYLGHSSSEYPIPDANRSGTPPHRFHVLNYYFQLCGEKRWYVADHDASMGSRLDGQFWMTDFQDILNFTSHPRVYEGTMEPGDLLLNPPWLWHYVQTRKGLNFGVSFKQIQFGMYADVAKMNELRARMFQPCSLPGTQPILPPQVIEGAESDVLPIPISEQVERFLYSDHPMIIYARTGYLQTFTSWARSSCWGMAIFCAGFLLGRCRSAPKAAPEGDLKKQL